jgi:Domain of unknown function (DUF4338)
MIRLGHDVRLASHGLGTSFAIRWRGDPANGQSAGSARIRHAQRERLARFVRAVSSDGDGAPSTSSLESFLAIRPRVEICRTRQQHKIAAYCKFLQSVPSAPRPGRRIRAIVFDDMPSGPAVIGAIELASPVYSIAARDRYLGWQTRDSDVLRQAGLRRTMDLTMCSAIPPYSHLRAGKLLAALAASGILAEEFGNRYGEPLLGLFGTCATGLHWPQLNRIALRPGGLYRRIGATAGYSTTQFSPETLRAARALTMGSRDAPPFGEGHSKAIPLMRTALRLCGLEDERFLKAGVRKGVYLGEIVTGATEALRVGRVPPRSDWVPGSDAIAWWRSRVLPQALRAVDGGNPLLNEQRLTSTS